MDHSKNSRRYYHNYDPTVGDVGAIVVELGRGLWSERSELKLSVDQLY